MEEYFYDYSISSSYHAHDAKSFPFNQEENDGDPATTPVWPELFHATMQQNRDGAIAHVDLYYDWENGRNMNIINDGKTILYDNERNNGSTYYYYPDVSSRKINEREFIVHRGKEYELFSEDESIAMNKKKTLRTLENSERDENFYGEQTKDDEAGNVNKKEDVYNNGNKLRKFKTLPKSVLNIDMGTIGLRKADSQCKVMNSGVGILTPDWLKGARYLGTEKVTTLNRGDVMTDVFSKNGAGHFPFVTYYNDIEQNIPVRWIFFDNATFDVLTWTENENLSEEEWQIPEDCF